MATSSAEAYDMFVTKAAVSAGSHQGAGQHYPWVSSTLSGQGGLSSGPNLLTLKDQAEGRKGRFNSGLHQLSSLSTFWHFGH